MKRSNYITQGALWTLGAVLVLTTCLFLWNIRSILLLLFISLLLASGIDPVVNWLRKGKLNRGFAILAVYTAIFGLLGLIFYLSLPPLIDELQSLFQNFSSQESARAAINNLDNTFLQDIALKVYQSAGDIASNLLPVSRALNLGLTALSAVFAILTVFVLTFYWLTERKAAKGFILSFFPEDKQGRADEIWRSVEDKLGAWVRGQLLMMLFIGVLSGIGYSILGVNFALALAVFAGLTELIPLVGPYLGGSAAFLVALTQSLTLALLVVGFVVILQFLEGNVLVPAVMQRAVGVSPLAVILGVTTGGVLAGIAGALLAVPLVAVIQVIYSYTWKSRRGGTSNRSGSQSSGEEQEPIKPARRSGPDPVA